MRSLENFEDMGSKNQFGYTSASTWAANGAFGYTFPQKHTPGDHVDLTLHGRPVTHK